MKRAGKLYPMTMTAAMAAVLAVVSPFALPLGPVPLSLCNMAVCLAAYVLGWRRGTAAVLIYLLLGAVGMPVFAGFTGGLSRLAGPTGGYILGYLPLAALTGLGVERFPNRRLPQLGGMVLGTAALYALGTAWYCVQGGVTPTAALAACVLPFLPGDGVKLVLLLAIGPAIRARLKEAGLLLQK